MTAILMLDIETLGTGPNAVAWQSALYGCDSMDPDTLFERPHFQYLPIQPQLDLMPARTVTGQTIIWWMNQVAKNPTLVDDFEQCDSIDFDELPSLLRHFLRTFDRYTEGGNAPYELWTRGNFDLPIMESLLRQCGLPIPWNFRNTQDLRTLEKQSGVSYRDVPEPVGFIKHRADWDAKFQLRHWALCQKALAGNRIHHATPPAEPPVEIPIAVTGVPIG